MKLRAFFCVILTAVLIAVFPLKCIATAIYEPLSVSARSAILIDLDEKTVLYQKNAKERMAMASTTKIVTALVACELLKCDTVIKIPREAVGVEGSSVYLQEGEMLTVEQLLYALLLESANDVAVALAVCASGSIEAFAQKCNEKAYALKNQTVAKICASKRAEIPYGITEENPEGESLRYLKNHNKMLSSYNGAIGVKTGFTKKSGRCLVSAAERNGLTLIAVTLNAPNDWQDHTAMLDFGFENFERRVVFERGEFCYDFPLSNGERDFVKITNLSPIEIVTRKNAPPHSYTVEACFRFAIAPVQEGQIIGKLRVTLNGKEYVSTLVCNENIGQKQKKHSFFN